MIIHKFFLIKFPSKQTPFRASYGLAALIDGDRMARMKNGRVVRKKELMIFQEFNPEGLVSKSRMRHLYSDKRIDRDPVHVTRNNALEYRSNNSYYECYDLLKMINEAMEHPMELKDIAPYFKTVYVHTIFDGRYHNSPLKIEDDISFNWYTKKQEGHSFNGIEVGEHFLCESQRKEAERDFYLINVGYEKAVINYVIEKKGDHIICSSYKDEAKQFKSESEAFRYIEKYRDLFGETGYFIEKVKGMTMEEGFAV